jgi:4-hydroxythreonine-4-phosphate dehydrogenase
MDRPILGITMGDAAGIGPELILKALGRRDLLGVCRPLLLADPAVMERYRKLLDRMEVRFRIIRVPEEARYDGTEIDLLRFDLLDAALLRIGEVSPEAGRASVVLTREAGRLAMDGVIDAIVSAPVNKEAMRAAGYPYEGQTQILGEVAGSGRYGMILLLGTLRLMMLTTHVALRKACDAVTRERVLAMIELGNASLISLGISNPRIAVAALNPHGGEGGLFGTEEIEGSVPAIQEAASRNINVTGPIPADVVFLKAKEGEYDLVLAMYHDQANMAAKMLGFGHVVTLLAGVPFVRTSVGHGTAFDIAGQGVADENNFVLAMETAAKLARGRPRPRSAREGV